MSAFDSLAASLSEFNAGCLDVRKHRVQIGISPDAVIEPWPQVSDLSAKDIANIAGNIGQGSSPSFGLRVVIPTVHLVEAIARGAAERAATLTDPDELQAAAEFYQYSYRPGTCLSTTPSTLNPVAGARWLITREDNNQYEYFLARDESARSPTYVHLTFVRCDGHSSRSAIYLQQ